MSEPETITIYKAQKTGDKDVQPITLKFVEDIPKFENIYKSERLFQTDALDLADTLCAVLPGGTLDRLIVELLKRKVSNFVVPLFK
jgi:hypothetical protein